MLYKIGPVSMNTRPFNADKFGKSSGADIAKKPVIGTLKPKEFMGESDEEISISGQLLPFKTGGLSELSILESLAKAGTPLPVMRGDGKALGWFMIERIRERHKELMKNGVGFVVIYTVKLTKAEPGITSSGVIGLLFEAIQNG